MKFPLLQWKKFAGKTDAERDYLADAIIKFLDHDELEIILLETSGPYANKNNTKISFDNHKAMFGLLAMLRQVALTYPYADIDELYGLKLYFVQASGTSINLWSMSYLECDLYDMWREESVQLPITFETKEDLVGVIQFFWMLKEKLRTTLNVLNNLKQQHADNKRSKRYSKGKSVLLTDFINPKFVKLTERKHSKGMSTYGPFESPEKEQ